MEKKHIVLNGIAVFFLICLTVWGFSISSYANSEDFVSPKKIRYVPTAVVQELSNSTIRTFPGEVRAKHRVELAFSVSGLLKELNAQEGRNIKKGDVLAKLDRRDYQFALDRAKAAYVEAKNNFNRACSLKKTKVISIARYEQIKASFEKSKAEFHARTKALKDTLLLAPFDGVIAKRYVENHEHIQAKQPILSLQDISTIEIVIQVPERMVALSGTESLQNIKVHFDADFDRWFNASVKEFSVQADAVTRTYDVVVGLTPPDDMKILSGMSATVKVETAQNTDLVQQIVLIPVEAVFGGINDESFVWIIKKDGGIPQKTKVSIGAYRKNCIEILSGLQAEQLVAIAGVHTLQKETNVRPAIKGREGLDG